MSKTSNFSLVQTLLTHRISPLVQGYVNHFDQSFEGYDLLHVLRDNRQYTCNVRLNRSRYFHLDLLTTHPKVVRHFRLEKRSSLYPLSETIYTEIKYIFPLRLLSEFLI